MIRTRFGLVRNRITKHGHEFGLNGEPNQSCTLYCIFLIYSIRGKVLCIDEREDESQCNIAHPMQSTSETSTGASKSAALSADGHHQHTHDQWSRTEPTLISDHPYPSLETLFRIIPSCFL